MTRTGPRLRRIALRILAGLGALAVALALYLGTLQLTGNFHTVIAGELYRSAQPDAASIARWHARYGIRSIVNLRGAEPGEEWYDSEVAEAASLGMAHYDFRMSASRDIDSARAAELTAILREAPAPILIHCRSGSDRTGLAAALYLAHVAGRGEEEAEAQISLFYGHFSVPVSATWAMDRSWEVLEPWLGFTGS